MDATISTKVTQYVQLKCVTDCGMFPHECSIMIEGVGRWYESIVDKSLLNFNEEGDPKSGRVSVEIIQIEDGRYLIELPRQVVDGGRRIWVPESELEM